MFTLIFSSIFLNEWQAPPYFRAEMQTARDQGGSSHGRSKDASKEQWRRQGGPEAQDDGP
jgi:hypothetical protein